MKIPEKLKEGKVISIEIVPPKRGEDVENIYRALDKLMKYNISFVNITRHPVEIEYIEHDNQIIKVPKVKRPGTIGLTAAIMKRYDVDVVPHIVCIGMNKYEIEDLLIDLSIMGVDNVFVIRGDVDERFINTKSDYKYAYQLVSQINEMNSGRYLYTQAKPTDFCIGVAGYPEKHYEAPNFETDLRFLKQKVGNGADFVITQMVFSAEVYKSFVERCRSEGINVPIIPGVKPLVNKKSLYMVPKRFFVSIPQSFVEALENARSKEEEYNVGIKFSLKLIEALFESGAPGVHLFTMGRGDEICEIMKEIENVL
ncbi:MAG: methylenetetrahydrofolate reductase [Fervidobacterium sp.]|uniref:Methylenetetrahydrofolate reductase n=1 Tax=Fervidobacterium gondwanense DSM 13020 TaxID=1121883 RepID=A0A1M7SRU0_FERGO|nr:methylenetetrahydrofolate reductase [Fervidobacterium gondwanense]UXF00604.1 methylenetetrahydrofolate reductase [Fervidobacterium riparium]SHN61090.1 methylenetetrahydrofolate reductase (NADPH) [Fervidobacterium gondwanense DSM 13020]